MTNTLQWCRRGQDGFIKKNQPDSGGGIVGLVRKAWGCKFSKILKSDEPTVTSKFPR